MNVLAPHDLSPLARSATDLSAAYILCMMMYVREHRFFVFVGLGRLPPTNCVRDVTLGDAPNESIVIDFFKIFEAK